MAVDQKIQRKKAGEAFRGVQNIDEMTYNEQSGAKKVLPLGGRLVPLGSLAAAIKMASKGATVAVYNNAAAAGFIKSAPGPTAPTAPTGGADGVAVPPNAYLYYSMKDDLQIIGSAATLFAYLVEDDSYYAGGPQSGT